MEAIVRIVKLGPVIIRISPTPTLPQSALSSSTPPPPSLPAIPGLELPNLPSPEENKDDADMRFLFVVPDLWQHFVAIAAAHTSSFDVSVSTLTTVRDLCKITSANQAMSPSPKQAAVASLNSVLMNALVAEGILAVLFDIFRKQVAPTLSILENILPVLNMFAANDEDNRTLIGKELGNEIVLLLQEKGSQFESIAEGCIRSIINYSRSADVRDMLGQGAVFEAVNEMLIFYGKSNVGLAESGCRAINNLIYASETNKSKLMSCGAHETVIGLLQSIAERGNNRGLAIAGFQVISGLCIDSPARIEQLAGLESDVIAVIETVLVVFGYVDGDNEEKSATDEEPDQGVIDVGLQALDILCGVEATDEMTAEPAAAEGSEQPIAQDEGKSTNFLTDSAAISAVVSADAEVDFRTAGSSVKNRYGDLQC
jgi:hypothetical protein